jgi:hypothetical protein
VGVGLSELAQGTRHTAHGVRRKAQSKRYMVNGLGYNLKGINVESARLLEKDQRTESIRRSAVLFRNLKSAIEIFRLPSGAQSPMGRRPNSHFCPLTSVIWQSDTSYETTSANIIIKLRLMVGGSGL